jgi:hypothetical protein
MGKKLIVTGLFVLAGCTPEHLAIVKEIAKVAAEFKGSKPAQVELTPTPTLSPTPTSTASPTAAGEPEKDEGKEAEKPKATITPGPPPPCGKRPAEDGFKRNFTWKPTSDTQKWAVAVLPPSIPGECTIAGLKARYKGDIGGYDGAEPRAVMILDRWTGEKLEKTHGPIVVRCGCWEWHIAKPSKRYD